MIFIFFYQFFKSSFVKSCEITPVLLGTFVSSRRGFSISFLKVINEEVYYWLDYPTEVDIWPRHRDREWSTLCKKYELGS